MDHAASSELTKEVAAQSQIYSSFPLVGEVFATRKVKVYPQSGLQGSTTPTAQFFIRLRNTPIAAGLNIMPPFLHDQIPQAA
jgi:hypothetical protein